MTANVHPLQGMFSFCSNNHPLTEDNVYIRASGSRRCRECSRAALRRYRAKKSLGDGYTPAIVETPRRRPVVNSALLVEISALFQVPADAWQERALCKETDPEAFFPEKGGSTREAKRICQGCEVRAECLEYALGRHERHGIWGGLSERERRKLAAGDEVAA